MSDDYGAFGIKQLWQMINAAKNDLELTHKQIGAWQRAQQMLNQHATALRGFRDQLAAKWPPESNAASAAYLSELDRLLEAVSATAHASSSNAVQIGHVTDVIEQTHKKLDGLHKGYVDNEAKLAHYNAQLDAIGSAVGAQKGSLIGGLARGASKVLTESPVADGAQEHLLRQAREAMTAASSAARDASANLQLPPEYIPPDLKVDKPPYPPEGGAKSGDPERPPSIAPPRQAPDQSFIVPKVHHLPQPDVGIGGGQDLLDLPERGGEVMPNAPRPDHGPILSEGPARTTPIAEPAPGGPHSRVPIGGSSLHAPGPIPPPILRAQGLDYANLGRQKSVIVQMGRLPGIDSPRSGPVMGVPGARVGTDISQNRMQRVNPIGGLVGSGSAGGVVGGLPGAGMAGGSSSNRGSAEKSSARRQWDPDNPWEVEEGVLPVIVPEVATRIDPGPGIIGIDR